MFAVTYSKLERPVTQEEVKASMFSIGRKKVPRPDGLTAHFFQVSRSIVSKEVVDVVEYFFATSDMLLAFNSSIVALVPK